MKKSILIIIFFICSFVNIAWAASSFVVQNIEIQGLQRISPDTVYNYLPIHKGQTFSPSASANIIGALYRTGFFEHIALARMGNTLIIKVVERQTIGQLKITGNSFIPTDKLTSVMKGMDIAEGRAYNPAVLDRIRQSLLNQYYQLGRYNARVDICVEPMPRNRMLVKIEISEGLVSKVRNINIIGCHCFSSYMLGKQLELTTPSILTFFTQTDRYSQEKLEASLENLRNFYLDHGYLRFEVKSAQVAITPDRKSIYLTIVIEEGVQYTIKGFQLSGDLILPRDYLASLVHIAPGCVFSRQAIVDAEKTISDALGDHGYAFATVSLNPVVDEKCKQVFLNFDVKPGKRTYVNHITFCDNSKTNDIVLRREIEQMESAVISTSKLELSKHKLSMLPFIKEVQMEVKPVPNTDDQVDVNYKVTEDNAASANFSVGYSQVERIILSAGVNQKNFLGTGKTLGVNLTRSRYQQYYGVNFTDPYFTQDGISRTVTFSLSRFDPRKVDFGSGYATDQIDITDVYSIPLLQEKCAFTRLQIGYGYQNTLLHLASSVSNQIQDFVNRHGRRFQQAEFLAGISRDSRDKAIFPTSGMLHTLGVDIFLPLGIGNLKYYTLAYNNKMYLPLGYNFVGAARMSLGYGNAFNGVNNFPFFKNYFAGGIDTVRGYLGNTLGPKDSQFLNTGGNFLAVGSLGLILPPFISDHVRTTLFFDVGNVYNTFDNRIYGGYPSGPVRYSTGIEVDWLTPFGLLDLSLAKPLKVQRAKHGQPGKLSDSTEPFQFSLGANFG